MSEGHIPVAPSGKTMLTVLVGASAAAAAILLGAVLPAEYHLDPLGIGKATGLMKLSEPQPKEVAVQAPASARSYAHALRTDVVEIPLAAAGDPEHRDQTEWKVRMRSGETLVYSWSVDAPAEEFYFDMHGESPPQPEVKVVTYKKQMGVTDSGAIVAPFDGIHGWYLQNQSEKPVVVRVKLGGFYEITAR